MLPNCYKRAIVALVSLLAIPTSAEYIPCVYANSLRFAEPSYNSRFQLSANLTSSACRPGGTCTVVVMERYPNSLQGTTLSQVILTAHPDDDADMLFNTNPEVLGTWNVRPSDGEVFKTECGGHVVKQISDTTHPASTPLMFQWSAPTKGFNGRDVLLKVAVTDQSGDEEVPLPVTVRFNTEGEQAKW